MLKFNRRNKRLVIPVGINPNYGIDSSTLYNTNDADIAASDVLEGKVGYGKDGKIIGTLDIQSEKEESYQEGYEFGYNEGNEAGYQLGYNEGNEAGIEIGKAEVIEGMNDATITAGTVFKGEIGYGKDGERIVGDYEFVEGFDFGVIGYSENESNTVNRSISDDIAYSKTLYDAWDPSRTSAQSYFANNDNLVYAPKIDTSNVTNMYQMFYSCNSLTSVPLFDTSNVTNMQYMFSNCSNLTSVSLFDTSNVTNMNNMFYRCENLTNVPLFDTSNVTNMNNTFYYCSSLTSVPLFDTSNVTDMGEMFHYCSSLTNVPLFDTSKVTKMNYMFGNCSNLTSVPLFDTSKVTSMYYTFDYCTNLTYIPLFNMSSVTNTVNMFRYCGSLTNVDGFTNLGRALTGSSTYTLGLPNSSRLTRQSCLNIFNTIYDMNLNTEYLGTAEITLHSTPYALLSADDIAIATSKGWTVQSA